MHVSVLCHRSRGHDQIRLVTLCFKLFEKRILLFFCAVFCCVGMYDQVYESQYGQFEKSYGELKYDTTKKPVEEKKKNMFGW